MNLNSISEILSASIMLKILISTTAKLKSINLLTAKIAQEGGFSGRFARKTSLLMGIEPLSESFTNLVKENSGKLATMLMTKASPIFPPWAISMESNSICGFSKGISTRPQTTCKFVTCLSLLCSRIGWGGESFTIWSFYK